MKEEDRVFTFSCEFDDDSIVDEIAKPNEEGLVSSSTPSPTTTKVETQTDGKGTNHWASWQEEESTTKEDNSESSVLNNSIPLTLLICAYLL